MPGGSDEAITSAAVLRAYESERARLARELHDGPVQSLANAIFRLQYCEALLERDPQTVRAALADVQGALRESLRALRQDVRDLRVSAVAELGLAPALRDYCAEFERHFGVRLRTEIDALEGRFSPEVEIALFRIVQEALQNVQKHARATRARVAAARRGAELVLRVEDNGRGFDPDSTTTRETFGLIGMRERSDLVGARLRIARRRGAGTVVEVRLPMQRLEAG